MQEKLQHRLAKKIFLFYFLFPFFWVVAPAICLSQTVLAPGELVVVSVSSGTPVNFEFVPLVNLEKETVLYFTDNAYISAAGVLTQSEGTLSYTAPESIPAGTVISYEGGGQNGFTGSEVKAGDSGDNIIVYQTTDTDTTFIYGIGWGGGSEIWNYDGQARADTRTDLPPGIGEADYTAVSLGDGLHHRYNTVRGLEGSPETLVRLVGDERNWNTGGLSLSEADIYFRPLSPPVLRFSTDSLSISESDREISLSVELIEVNGEAVSADVVFMEDLSTVSGKYIGNYTTQNVQFSGRDAAGTMKSVTVKISESNDYNESKRAVFGLRNNSAGSVATPQIVTVDIEDKEVPDVVITEINATPGDDADGNGVVDSSDDEFIEFVNSENTDVDISGWTFSDDGSTVRHVFPPGTEIPPSGALVLFANEKVDPVGSFGGAIVQNSNRSPTLHLNDRGDDPVLKDASGKIVAVYAYGSEASDNQSITRDSGTEGDFRKHSEVAGSSLLTSSPGTRVDGSSFGLKPQMGVRGKEGWRVLSLPTQNTTIRDLLGGYRIQGIVGSAAPTEEASIYYWEEASGGRLVKPDDVTAVLESGRGYMVYFFEDDIMETTDSRYGIPKIINVDKAENSNSISVSVTATDANENGVIDQNEGYNLLGNPFETYISVTGVLDALEKVDKSVNRNVLVWDPTMGEGNGGYKILTDGDIITPFQAFFVRFMSEVSGSAVLNKTDVGLRRGKTYRHENEENRFGYRFTLHDGDFSDTYHLTFREGGSVGHDKLDAYKLFSLNPGSLRLFSREGPLSFMNNVLPVKLQTNLEIPLIFEASDGKEQFEISWEGFGQLPESWDIVLLDRDLAKEIDLKNSSGYTFTHVSQNVFNTPREDNEPLVNVTETGETEPRFVLMVSPSPELVSSGSQLSESVKLNPNYPNPFNSGTNIPFFLPTDTEVTLSVWNIVGQKVATLIDGIREAGEHREPWNATDMPSGIYIAQLEVGGDVYIRKMTLIKR